MAEQPAEHVQILLNSTLDEESNDAPPLNFGGEDADQLTSIQGNSSGFLFKFSSWSTSVCLYCL